MIHMKMITQAEMLKILRSTEGRTRVRQLLANDGMDLNATQKIERLKKLVRDADELLGSADDANSLKASEQWFSDYTEWLKQSIIIECGIIYTSPPKTEGDSDELPS